MKKLICFPHAGGTASNYIKWKSDLNDSILLVPFEYAGRGKRIWEPCYESINNAIEDIYGKVMDFVDGHSYCMFGHSMGTIIIYELCRMIKSNGLNGPEHVFLSGRYPPHIKKKNCNLHIMPNENFISEILKMGGTSSDVFNNSELIDLFLPVLRADYKLVELYKYNEDNFQFDCGITAFTGKEDYIVSKEEIQEWVKYSSKGFNLYEYGGGHFYLNDHYKEIINIIDNTLFPEIIPY